MSIEEMGWSNFINWAGKQEDICKAFFEDTGINLDAKSSPIEAMIDKVVGFRDYQLKRFIVWVSDNYWSDPKDAPEAYHKIKKELEGVQNA